MFNVARELALTLLLIPITFLLLALVSLNFFTYTYRFFLGGNSSLERNIGEAAVREFGSSSSPSFMNAAVC